ncbi:MAG: S8 family peptidase [Clostridiales bacterium]|nr:S8 family peptidase [Clostridiales bacterium]
MTQTNIAALERLLRFDPRLVLEGRTELIVKYNGDIGRVAQRLGATVEILNNTFAILTIEVEQIPQLYTFPEVEFLELPKTLTFELFRNLANACITRVHGQRFGLRGQGTIIGIIDSGIDFTHPDFINDDGTTRILYLWDQLADPALGSPPQGFTRGVEYNSAQINEALQSPNPFDIVPFFDYNGHGTAVAGVAAGNGRASSGVQIGAAPEASLIVVKLGRTGNEAFARTTEIMRALKYIVDKARELNMPVSINISYGTNNGPHDGNTLFEAYIDSVAQEWKTSISVATGNEGAAAHHFTGFVVQGRQTYMEFFTFGDVYKLYVAIWKNFVDTFVWRIISPVGTESGEIRPTARLYLATMDGVNITVFFNQPTIYTESQEIYILFEGVNRPLPQGLWRIEVTGENVVDGRFDAWLPNVEDVSFSTAFATPNTDITLTLPSTASQVIAVGGYDARSGTVASFSGRGYTRNNIVKPDLVAPAVDVITTIPGGGYDRFSGTSIASPFVAGAAALMMEWGIVNRNDVFLYGQRVKAFLQKGARRNRNVQYPNNQWGYGSLCLEDTMLLLEQYTSGGIFI